MKQFQGYQRKMEKDTVKAGRLGSAGRFVGVLRKTVKRANQVSRAARREGMGSAGVRDGMQEWARDMLDCLRVKVHVSGPPLSPEPAIFVGNHVSYIDIPVLMSVTPVVFVAKKEIASWPIFGDACRSVGTVFVDRKAANSRKQAGEAVATTLQSRLINVCLFPSGTTCLDESKPWRKGPFQIARIHGLPIQPFRLSYVPERATAFIDDDALAPHLWGVLRQGHVDCHVEFGERLSAGPPEQMARQVWEWTKGRARPGRTS